MAPLADLIEKYGAEAIEKALAGGEEKAAGEAFNAPSFKVGETPATPQEFGQVVNATNVPNIQERGILAQPKTPNMTPVKEELPQFGAHLDPIAQAPIAPKAPSTWNELVAAAKENKLPKTLGIAGAATAGGLAMLPDTKQEQKQAPTGMAESLKARSGDEDDQAEEETPEEEVPVKSSTNNAPARSEAPQQTAAPSKTQTLADIMQAQQASGDNYQDALHHRDFSTLANQLGQAGNIIGGALAYTGPNAAAGKMFDQNIALAQQGPKDYVEGKHAELLDPNSAVSQNYREFLKRYGVSVGPGVTAQQIKDTLLPSAQKEQDIQEKLAATKAKVGETNTIKELARQDRLDKNTTNRIDKAGKMLDAELASSRSAFGRSANTSQSAEKIEALVQGIDPNDLDKRQITEIARNLDGMLANGQPTISGMNKLIPSSWQGDASKIAEYITGIPKGAQQAEFVNRLMSTVSREKALARKQLAETQSKILGPYNDLKDQAVFQEMLRMKGIPSDVFEKQRAAPSQAPLQKAAAPMVPNEVERKTSDGKTAIFDSNTKQFLRYKE